MEDYNSFDIGIIKPFLVLAFLISNFGTNISAAIYAFRLRSMNITSSDYVSLPGFVRLIRRIALAAGYIVMYLFFNGIVYKSKKIVLQKLYVLF